MILPRISVAMSVYNNATYLPHAIESILAQTFSDFEFLIVDDGSTDESGAIIDRFAHLDSRIKPIHQANAGLIVSLNYMISLAQAPLIARMDGDDIARTLCSSGQVSRRPSRHRRVGYRLLVHRRTRQTKQL
jgi:glycosyltransferase involved in cell wall biosynthesis